MLDSTGGEVLVGLSPTFIVEDHDNCGDQTVPERSCSTKHDNQQSLQLEAAQALERNTGKDVGRTTGVNLPTELLHNDPAALRSIGEAVLKSDD